MRTFVDAKNTKWNIDLNVSAIRRVKSLVDGGIDLTLPQSPDATYGTLSQRLVLDVWLLVDVLCAVCRPQADAAGISDEEFAERLGGNVIGIAKGMLFEEWADFFRNLGRADLAAAVEKTINVLQAVGLEAIQQMDKLSDVLMDQARQTMQTGGKRAIADAVKKMASASGD